MTDKERAALALKGSQGQASHVPAAS